MFQEDILEMTNEIQVFKNEFESKYNKNLNILVSDHSDVVVNVRLEKIVLGTMRSIYPDLRMRSLGKDNRKREFVIFKQLFCYMCSKMGFTLQYIGAHINKHHASVIHSIKQVEGLLEINDPQLHRAYKKLKINMKNYVRTIPEDIKGQAYTQPITSFNWEK